MVHDLIQSLRLMVERRSMEIDKAWVEGIRKTWKAWASRAGTYPGYVEKADTMEHTLIEKAVDDALAYLTEGVAFVHRLREDLLFNKGFWSRPKDPTGGPKKTKPFDQPFELEMKGKVINLLAEADEHLAEGVERVKFWKRETHPEHGRDRAEAYRSQEDFDRYLRTVSLAAKEAAINADAVVSRQLLRHLSVLTKKAGGVIDFGGYEPAVVKVGAVTAVFKDTPARPERKSAKAHDPDEARHPSYRKEYIASFIETQALLRRRGLGHIWYGIIEIEPKADAPTNPYGAHFGTGAVYYRQGDKVVIYAQPKNLARLLAHELGHRYYYKFMSLADRERFSEWFGKVSATSTYGATVSPEDFAEVFSEYVMGTDLTRDQIERLKAFLDKKEKRESLDELVDQLRHLV